MLVNFSNSEYMICPKIGYYGKGVSKCLHLRCVCDILKAVIKLARDVRHFAFCVCAILGFEKV